MLKNTKKIIILQNKKAFWNPQVVRPGWCSGQAYSKRLFYFGDMAI
jgi:hypothetical protein